VGNVAYERSLQNDHSSYTPEFRSRHSSTWPLTELGQEQARSAGDWLRINNLHTFDRYSVSPYVRALETAALLSLPTAHWYIEPYLREREWGTLDALPSNEQQERFAEALAKRDAEGYYWKPPNGESFASASIRIDQVIEAHSREHSHGKTIIVCHEEIMKIFRTRIEHVSEHEFKSLIEHPDEKIHNCQILHYTRRDERGKVHPFIIRRRSICPWDENLTDRNWKPIERKSFKNEDLQAIVETIKENRQKI
jgi:NAD+ kinase